MEHLAATLALRDRVVLLDEPDGAEMDPLAPDVLAIFTSCIHRGGLTDTSFQLAPWTDDDVIEYLLTIHPAQSRSVMQRFQADTFRPAVGAAPE